MQKYRPDDACDVVYSLTFDIMGVANARILLSEDFRAIDLSDLYEHPWWEYRLCGYSRICVARVDGNDLSYQEIE